MIFSQRWRGREWIFGVSVHVAIVFGSVWLSCRICRESLDSPVTECLEYFEVATWEWAMPEWLSTVSAGASSHDAKTLAVRLSLAVVFGTCVAGIYRFSHGRRKADASVLATTLVLLCILTAMVSVVIGDSVARAFGLVGALSIVRFRTVVDDTRDTAFVIFAVIVGMAIGGGLILIPLLGIPIVALSALALEVWGDRELQAGAASWDLTVRLGLGHDAHDFLKPSFVESLADWTVTSAATARGGSALDVKYRIRFKPNGSPTEFVGRINRVEGVQSVELQQAGRE